MDGMDGEIFGPEGLVDLHQATGITCCDDLSPGACDVGDLVFQDFADISGWIRL